MRRFLLICAFLVCVSTVAQAQVLGVPEPVPVPSGLPAKGLNMEQVERDYGPPLTRHKPVGGNSSVMPPITRWDYASYSVFFERRIVIDAVARDAPAPIVDRDGLTAPGSP
jgi:hypothetical protein